MLRKMVSFSELTRTFNACSEWSKEAPVLVSEAFAERDRKMEKMNETRGDVLFDKHVKNKCRGHGLQNMIYRL